jgi:hypothetical protein
MKIILAVWNRGGRGKTQSIQEFAKDLLTRHPSHIIKHLHPSPIPSKAGQDFRLIVEIKGKIIVIESQGDPNTNLEVRLEQLVIKYNCDILICSTRTSGATVHAVENIGKKHGFEIMWSSTYEMNGMHGQMNSLKGKHMVDTLVSLGII